MPLVPIEEYKPKETKQNKLVPIEEYKPKLVPLEQSSSPQKLSEAELKENPEWIRAAKSIYEWNEGRNFYFKLDDKPKKLNSDKEYADYALRYMGWFNYNIPKMTKEASDLKFNANQQQREDFVTLMDMYDNKEASLAGTGRLIKGLAFDPSTYVGIGTFGIGLGAREGTKFAAKQGIKELVKQGAKQGAKIGAIEGAAYSTVDNALRQSTRVMSGQQEGFELGQSAKAAALGAGIGAGLGGTIGGGASFVKNKNKVPVQADEVVGPIDMVGPRLETPPPKVDIKKQIDDELIKIGVDPVKVEGVPKLSAKQGFVSPELNNVPEDYGILGGRVNFKIDYDNPKNTANKLKEFFINQDSLDNFKLTTPKVETAKPKSTKIPEILKIPKKPKVRTARSYIEGGKIRRDFARMGELKQILESDKGFITSKYLAPKNSRGFTDFDQIQEAMQEDGFLPELQTFDGGDTPDFTNRIIDDLQMDRVHQDDQLLLTRWEEQTEQARTIRQTLDDFNIDYRGMSDDDVLVTYNKVINNEIPPVRDEVPLGVYADDIAAAEGGNINKVKADDVIDTPDGKDFQTDTTTGLNQKVIDVGQEIIKELNIPVSKNVRISDQLKEAVLLANSSPKFFNQFVDILKRNDLTVEELSSVFKESISDSARRMQQLSTAKQSMKRMGQELGEIAPDEGWYANFAKEYTDIVRDLDNIRRGLLVSQIATAMRNNTAQIGRVGMHTLIEAFDDVLDITFNPLRKAFGAKPKKVDGAESFRLMMNLTKNKKQSAELTEFLTKYFVNESDRLFTKYASEVADSSKAKVFKSAQKMVDGLNTLNRIQEFWYRRGMFATSIQDTLSKKGIDIKDVGINDDLLKYLNASDIEKAVDDALYFTYAKTPDNKLLKGFVDIANSVPFITTGVFPFARFMANAIDFQFRHSPLGFLKLLTPSEHKKIAAGDSKAFSEAVVGTTILLATIEAKRKGSEDNKWYEVETSSGKTIDMRPYFPLTPYLFVADVVTRLESGRNWGDPKDILQALTGAQFRAGASSQLVQNILDGMVGLDTEEKLNKYFSDYVSDVIGGFLTPLRMFNDFIDQDQEFRAPVPTGEFLTDTTNRLKSSIPIVREQLPELESPTREATPGRPDTVQIPFTNINVPGPLTRQLTGATVREEKNTAEREFDRLGFKRRDILPYSGNAIVDQTRAKYMGKPVEIMVGALVESDFYKSKTNAEKELLVRKLLQSIRGSANDYIKENKINEEAFQKASFNRQPKYMKKLLAEKGITWKTFNDTSNGENR